MYQSTHQEAYEEPEKRGFLDSCTPARWILAILSAVLIFFGVIGVMVAIDQ